MAGVVEFEQFYQRILEIRAQQGKDVRIDLQSDVGFGANLPKSFGGLNEERHQMKMGADVFDKELFFRIAITNLYIQRIKLTAELWKTILEFYFRDTPHGLDQKDFFKNREKFPGQLAIEMFSVVSNLDATDYYERCYGNKSNDPNIRETQRDHMFEVGAIEKIFIQANAPDWEIALEFVDRRISINQIREFLNQNVIKLAIMTAIDGDVKPGSTFEQFPNHESVVAGMEIAIRDMKIYLVESWAEIEGFVVTDGFVICLDKLRFLSFGDPRAKANLFTLAIHEFAHFWIRQVYSTYGWRSPTSYLPVGAGVRRDHLLPERNLEVGRAAEIALFGYQVDWRRVQHPFTATDFLARLRIMDKVPIYRTPEDALKAGLVPLAQPSFAFAAYARYENQLGAL